MTAESFFAFARLRHAITLARRAGLPRPWTDDAILQHYRFTNVFRELDRTTLWIAEHVRRPLDAMLERGEIEPWQQVLGIVLAREFNRTTTLEQIFCQPRLGDDLAVGWLYLREPDTFTISDLEHYMRAHCLPPWVTGAYIIKTPDGMDKLAGALWMVERARGRLRELARDPAFGCSMEALHADLRELPYLGGFTAYEVVTDVRHMSLGRGWHDVDTWACAGPGAIRGLHRIHGRARETGEVRPDGSRVVKFPALPERQALAEMRGVLVGSRSTENWPTQDGRFGNLDCELLGAWTRLSGEWPAWEMREVEHTLCEYDKYERVRLGQGAPRGRFK